MKKSIRSLQAGRSMIELIAVMAVMGILLIAGLVGFKLLLDYLKQKETVEQITTIGMRYKASRLNTKVPHKGYVPMTQVYPEGNECENNDKECIVTPEGSTVKLYSMGESKNFVVLVNQLKSTSCQELAVMGGYEFAFKSPNPPNSNSFDENFPRPSEIIKKGESRTSFTFTNNNNEYVAFTPEYLKANPTVLKSFCDSNIPLGFTYSADEDCDYFYDGACHDCPEGKVQDSTGECCTGDDLKKPENCGLCKGCGTKKCLEDEQRCVECIDNTDCDGNPNGNICVDNHCVQCNGEDGCSGDDMCCNARHECIAINDTFWTRNDNGSCICKDVGLGGQCEADCNCAHLGATFKCMNVGGNAVKTCAKDPNGCEGEYCADNRVCCRHSGQTNGVCCNEGEFCKDGVCSKCTDDSDCGAGKTCCNGACYSETVETCGDECCTEGQQCLTDENDKQYCGNNSDTCVNLGLTYCKSEGDCCEVGYYCHETLGCVECSEQPIKTCGDSEKQTFNNECYAKKHLNCLDETDVKSDNDLREMIEDDDITDPEKKPICAGESGTTSATCDKCTADTQCAQLKGQGGSNVLNQNYVCRSGHTGADEKYNGTCGKCIKDSDCDNGKPCINGMCGCVYNTDCEGNIIGTKCLKNQTNPICGCELDTDCQTDEHLRIGKTKCNIDDNGVGTCGCDDGLELDQKEGYCVCKVNPKENFWTRYTENTATDQKYICCPKGEVATMVGTTITCVRMCKKDEHISVAMMLDYSWSGKNIKVGGKTFDSTRTELARAFINGLKQINSDIRFGVFRENNNGKTDAQEKHRCEGNKNYFVIQGFPNGTGTPDLNQDLCAYSNGQGETTFTAAINEIKEECNDNRENTIVLVLSDGMIPTDTATDTGCDPNNMYVYADGKKSFKLPELHEAQFTATPDSRTLLNMFANKICVNPQQIGAVQPGYNTQNP